MNISDILINNSRRYISPERTEKGSCSHTNGSIAIIGGYRVGLFPSHLVDFRERIRINGEMIPERICSKLCLRIRSFFEPLHPSFSSLTPPQWHSVIFANQKVDVAGGSKLAWADGWTVPISSSPTSSLPTRLRSYAISGRYITKIAKEKAGIIKEGVPVVIEAGKRSREARVHNKGEKKVNAPVIYASIAPHTTAWTGFPYSQSQEVENG